MTIALLSAQNARCSQLAYQAAKLRPCSAYLGDFGLGNRDILDSVSLW